MKKKIPSFFSFPFFSSLSSLSSLSLLSLLVGCGNDQRIQPGPVDGAPTPAVIQGFSMMETAMGQAVYELKATVAYVDPTRPLIQGAHIDMVWFNQKGERVSRLTADKGWLETNSNNMRAMGHVLVRATSGSTLETETLQWDQQSQIIKTDDEVRILQRNNLLTGKGMRSDPGLDRIEIYQADALVTDPGAFQHEMQSLK